VAVAAKLLEEKSRSLTPQKARGFGMTTWWVIVLG
jgi:hypothetical protein